MNFSIILANNILMDTVVVVASTVNVSAHVSNILMLYGTNFKVLKDTIKIVLGCMNLDIVLRQEKPIATEKMLIRLK